ncbi:phosphatase PAP2 family protein [Actinoplanes sp. NPDC020271]|uniref:phosphatase PAP2 family protein n=1 Tax=Actinoplanes sp. NPDC020271 TaxID=3363896 RepID=UPI0037B23F7F
MGGAAKANDRADSRRRAESHQLVKNGMPEIPSGAPHGMAGPYQEEFDKDLLEFWKRGSKVRDGTTRHPGARPSARPPLLACQLSFFSGFTGRRWQFAGMNYRLFELINGLAGRTDSLDDVMEFASTWLIFAVFAVAAALAASALRRRRIRPVAELGAALVLGFAGAQVLSHLSGQLRPFQSHHVHQLIPHEPGVSLPSDHATAAFTIAFAVFAFLSRAWGVALMVAAIAVGVARVWVGVHYPGDIAAGAVIAVLAVGAVAVYGRMRISRVGSATVAG